MIPASTHYLHYWSLTTIWPRGPYSASMTNTNSLSTVFLCHYFPSPWPGKQFMPFLGFRVLRPAMSEVPNTWFQHAGSNHLTFPSYHRTPPSRPPVTHLYLAVYCHEPLSPLPTAHQNPPVLRCQLNSRRPPSEAAHRAGFLLSPSVNSSYPHTRRSAGHAPRSHFLNWRRTQWSWGLS